MATSPTRATHPALRRATIRRLHAYVSAFVAPSLLFFALTGALQTFRLPDQPGASQLLVKLARVHKDDVFAAKPSRAKRPDAPRAPGERPAQPRRPEAPATTALKAFFALTSVGMMITTLFGLWMALAFGESRRIVGALLVAGAAIPAILLAI